MSLLIKKSFSGLGLFANRDFQKNEYIIEYFGNRISDLTVKKSKSKYLFCLTKAKTIDGSNKANIARYINHSCKPNVEKFGYKRIWIHAMRRIKKGEELYMNYGDEYIKEFIKKCLCPKCKSK